MQIYPEFSPQCIRDTKQIKVWKFREATLLFTWEAVHLFIFLEPDAKAEFDSLFLSMKSGWTYIHTNQSKTNTNAFVLQQGRSAVVATTVYQECADRNHQAKMLAVELSWNWQQVYVRKLTMSTRGN